MSMEDNETGKSSFLFGRMGRLRYLAWYFVSGIPMVINFGFMKSSEEGGYSSLALIGVHMVFFAINVLLIPLPLFFSAKRLHDIGYSAWFLLLYLIPIVHVLLVLALLLAPGNRESNKYGDPPPPNGTSIKMGALACILVAFAALLLGQKSFLWSFIGWFLVVSGIPVWLSQLNAAL